MTESKPHAESAENAEKDSAKICEVGVTSSKPHAESAENAEKISEDLRSLREIIKKIIKS